MIEIKVHVVNRPGGPWHEKNLSTQQRQAQENARVSGSDADSGRPQSPQAEKSEGTQEINGHNTAETGPLLEWKSATSGRGKIPKESPADQTLRVFERIKWGEKDSHSSLYRY